MLEWGFTSCLWYKTLVLEEDDTLFKFNRLRAYAWGDDRLVRLAEVRTYVQYCMLYIIFFRGL
jgi:hypothetical protein